MVEQFRVIKVLEEAVLIDEIDYAFVVTLGLSIVRRDDLKHVIINTQPYYKKYLHRILLKVESSVIIVDHKNRNGLDNRRENLRATTKVGNALNMRVNKNKKSGLPKGIYKEGNGYRACIQVNGLYKYLGHFNTILEAQTRYEEEQKKVWQTTKLL